MKVRVKEAITISNFDKILKSTPLKTRLWVVLQMDDYENWDNGDYKGNVEELKRKVELIKKEVEDWVEDGMPKEK